ncbi:MAG: hypothetical protein K2N84_07065 [Clostridia bacterium]|nr:hypothetical protein [Clostridia bacterium]
MRKLKRMLISIALVLLAGACGVFALLLHHSPVFEKGERYELYYGSSSSRMTVGANPIKDKLLSGKVTGESVRLSGDRREELQTRYQAELLFVEEACGVVNYYYYSPVLGGGVRLGEYAVNLHIAVSAEQTAAGTPLIFGGF